MLDVTKTQVATAGSEDEQRPRATEPAASTAGNSEKREATLTSPEGIGPY